MYQVDNNYQHNNESHGMHFSESILNSVWSDPERPYSQLELKEMFERLMLSASHWVQHDRCGHRYFVKTNGVKYKQLNEFPEIRDHGNCSVCWKVRKTPREIRDVAVEFMDYIEDEFPNMSLDNGRLTLYKYKVFEIFYTWLYKEDF